MSKIEIDMGIEVVEEITKKLLVHDCEELAKSIVNRINCKSATKKHALEDLQREFELLSAFNTLLEYYGEKKIELNVSGGCNNANCNCNQ